MKLTFEEKKLLYTYGCADLELTRKRLCGVAGLTVDPDQNKQVYDFCRKLEDETLANWYDQMFYFVRSEMEHYAMMRKCHGTSRRTRTGDRPSLTNPRRKN